MDVTVCTSCIPAVTNRPITRTAADTPQRLDRAPRKWAARRRLWESGRVSSSQRLSAQPPRHRWVDPDGWMDGCGRRLRTHGWENGSMISILVEKAMYAHPGPVLRPSLSDPSGACIAYLVSYWTRTTSRASKLASDTRRTVVSTGPCFALNDLHIPALESRATDTDSLEVTCAICRRFGARYVCRGLITGELPTKRRASGQFTVAVSQGGRRNTTGWWTG